MNICAVILAGGVGSRLWPLSRSKYPKQFLKMHGNDTLLQSTLKRVTNIVAQAPIIICNEEHRFLVAEQLRQSNQDGLIMLESEGKNTAPAVAIAALKVESDPLLLVVSSDHIIKDENAFANAVKRAVPLAEEGKLVTFGIFPKGPNTEYGYIRAGSKNGNGYEVTEFVEKPSYKLAKEYLETKKYYWNSGIFLFKASCYIGELKKFRPEMLEACRKAVEVSEIDLDFCRVGKSYFESCESESIDYAVMENTNDAVVVPMDVEWSDIGSWSALWEISEKDKSGNVLRGDVISYNSKNSYIATDDILVSVIDINNLIIVCTKDAVLVSSKGSVHNVKKIAKELQQNSRAEWEHHREVYRPWGKFDVLDESVGYKVKRITVNPGSKLSVQKHNHRAEHWVVVSGAAKVTKGDKTFILSENESTYISIGEVHALENCGSVDLELIEVQSGTYLGEDDIIRFEDRYGRDC